MSGDDQTSIAMGVSSFTWKSTVDESLSENSKIDDHYMLSQREVKKQVRMESRDNIYIEEQWL